MIQVAVDAVAVVLLAVLLHAEGGEVGVPWLVVGLALVGLGNTLILPSYLGVVLSAVRREQAGAASGALNTTQQFVEAAGLAAVGTVFFAVLGDRPDRAHYAGVAEVALWIGLGLVVAIAALSALLPPATAGPLTGSTPRRRAAAYPGPGRGGRRDGVRSPAVDEAPERARGDAGRHSTPTARPHAERPPRQRGSDMSIGPVQLIVLGFPQPDFHGAIIAELERLRESDTVRVIDALAVHKDPDGEVEVAHLSNLSDDEAVELGSMVGALIGLGIEGEAGIEAGAEAGAVAAAEGARMFTDEDAWDVLEEIPNGSAAALVLLEHTWAIPLRDAVVAAGGFRISDGFISPLDLVQIGLVSAQEAAEMHALETAAGVA